MNKLSGLLQKWDSEQITNYGLSQIKDNQVINQIMCHCTNNKIAILSLIRKYLQFNPLDVPARANMAMQLLWQGRGELLEAYPIILDLIGLEHQNVKTLIQQICRCFKKFNIISIQQQCELLLEMTTHYSIDVCALVQFFQQEYTSEMEQLIKIKDKNLNYYVRSQIIFKNGKLDEQLPEISYLYQLCIKQQIYKYQNFELNDIANTIAINQFNEYQFHEIHQKCFKLYSKRQTYQYLQSKQIPEINEKMLHHLEIEYQLYLLVIKNEKQDNNFMNSLIIVIFNMKILYSILNESYEIDLQLKQINTNDDPQQITSHIFSLGVLCLQQNYKRQGETIFEELRQLNITSLNSKDIALINQNVLQIIILNLEDQTIINNILQILRKIDDELYFKLALNYNLEQSIKTTPKIKVKCLIQFILLKQNNDILLKYIDQLYSLICQKESKNPQRSFYNFLELIHLFSYTLDNQILCLKLQEYFQIKIDTLHNALLQLYIQLEMTMNQQSLSIEYISVSAKLLYFNSLVGQKIINQRESSFYYFQQAMKQFKHLFNKLPKLGDLKKLPQYKPLIVTKPLKLKTTLINLALIERFGVIHKLDIQVILAFKLSLLKDVEVPQLLLLQLSKNEGEYNYLKSLYPDCTIPKQLKFMTKVRQQELLKQCTFKNKQLPNKPTLAQFLKQCHKLLLLRNITVVTRLQLIEQLLSELTTSVFLFKENPKYVDELYKEKDISLFKCEHRELQAFYSQKDIVLSHQLFYNQRADTLNCFLRLNRMVVKYLAKLGFYKAISKIMENIEIFMYRSLSIVNLIRIYSKIPWHLDQMLWQQFTDEVSNSIKLLNENKRLSIGEQQSECTRQSLYRQRKSYVTKLKDTHHQLMQIFQKDNLLNGKFQKYFSEFILEYLCTHNHSQTYLHEKLKINRKSRFSLKTNCCVLRQLLECSNPSQYQWQVDNHSIHELINDKFILNQIIPTLVLGVCSDEQVNQNALNYLCQLKLLVQNILTQALINDIEQSKLYFYLLLRIQGLIGEDYIIDSGPSRCNCKKQQPKFDENKFQFDLVASLASFQMNMKRILRLQEDISINYVNQLERTFHLTSIVDIHNIRKDIIVINLFEYNGEKIILISKYSQGHCENRSIKSISKCLQFKDALLYYLKIIQENIDCMTEKITSKQQWWCKRDYYEQQLLKRQNLIVSALWEQLDFIYSSQSPILLLSPQLQLLPWDHIRNSVFNRVLSLGHILDLINLQIDIKQDLFYVLNPGNDLIKTEETLLPVLKQYNLKGLTGQKPSTQQIIDCLQKKEYYMYIGHGGGEQYYSERQILQTHEYFNGRPYLLGCSSAQMIELSRFKINNVSQQEIFLNHIDWHGLAVSYLLRGCPTLFGALWPITDKDADKYAIDLIHQYSSNQILNPIEIIKNTKPKCVLKQFNGTAFVIYGISQ